MIAAISLFVVVFLSMLTTRIATIALAHTGLSKESARFQARSALTGSGFTTKESEQVVNHPVRRKIILLLMLIGNAGLVTAVSSLILTFVISDSNFTLVSSLIIIVFGVAGIWWAAQSQMIDRFLSRIIDKALRRYTSLDVRDYSALLHLSGNYQITELLVNEGDWLADKTLEELHLTQEGVVVLGIQREKGNFIGTPSGATKIYPNDIITIYGRASSFDSLDTRKAGPEGDKEHLDSIRKHSRVEQAEEFEDNIEE